MSTQSTLNFYRIASERGDEATPETASVALTRESYGCAERGDCTLFLWRDAGGEPRMLQFLFGEQFIEWTHEGGWRGGSTNRALESPESSGRGKGVRTLHGGPAEVAEAVLHRGLVLLRGAALPAPLADLVAQAGHA